MTKANEPVAWLENAVTRPVEVRLTTGVAVVPPRTASGPGRVPCLPADLELPEVRALLGRRVLRVRRAEQAGEGGEPQEPSADTSGGQERSTRPTDEGASSEQPDPTGGASATEPSPQ